MLWLWFEEIAYQITSLLWRMLASVSCVSGRKEERWKRKRERAEGEKRLTQMLLLEPSTPTQHDSIPSNQNHFRSLGCQRQVSKSSPKINLTLVWPSSSACVATISLFSKTSNEELSNTCKGKPAVFVAWISSDYFESLLLPELPQ